MDTLSRAPQTKLRLHKLTPLKIMDYIAALDLKAPEKAVLWAIARHADWNTGLVHISQERIAEYTSLDEKTVRKAQRSLERARVLEIIEYPKRTKTGGKTPYLHRITFLNDAAGERAENHPGNLPVEHPGNLPVSHREISGGSSKTRPLRTQSDAEAQARLAIHLNAKRDIDAGISSEKIALAYGFNLEQVKLYRERNGK